jgi:curved DNA-binding protein CbpA
MIDYFALLDQPRMPWLDLDKLKDAYHAKARQNHPDLQTGDPSPTTETSFANLNEAYQVLQDPKRRLHHLLSLEGAPPGSSRVIPQELQDLFPEVGSLTQRVKVLLEELKTRTNQLSKSLLKPQILQLQTEVNAMRDKIRSLLGASATELEQRNIGWAKNPAGQIEALSNLYVLFAYLNRWLDQLNEIAFQLALD